VGRAALLFVALVCAGIGAGSAYTTYFLFDPAHATPASWVVALQNAIPRIGVPLFVVQPIAGLATIASAVLARRDRPSFWFLVAAALCLVFAALVTRVVHIPINEQMPGWTPDALPADFAALQARWWTFHVVRSAALLGGLCALVGGALTRGEHQAVVADPRDARAPGV
jgi:uncharacterized membrane protein